MTQTTPLKWPLEQARPAPSAYAWSQPLSNICLDFHGDPVKAPLVVFSDGNHHMALEAAIQEFARAHPRIEDIFYATTPPGVLVRLLREGGLNLGNLSLSVRPHIFISPAAILEQLVEAGYVQHHEPFMESRGNVLLIKKGNPKRITQLADLLREEVRLFISNPATERASYEVYRDTLLGLAKTEGLNSRAVEDLLEGRNGRIHFGERIHHREAPQALADGQADVALIYYHLALRYTRIFPDDFEFIPLGGTPDDPQPAPANLCTQYHIGLVDDGGEWGKRFLEHMWSDKVTEVYAAHGLRRVD